MALLTVVINSTLATPRGPVALLACGTGNTQGFTFSLSDYASMAKIVAITGDADWYWSHNDTGTASTSGMARVRADQPLRLSVHTPVTIYCKTASGTANLWVTVEV